MAVFIIPGFFSTKNRYKSYNELASNLKQKGFRVEIIDLGLNLLSLKTTTKKVIKYLKSTSEKDDIIAHSFGGIVIKNIINKNPNILKQIKSIIFVAVPHHGSWATLLVPIWPATIDLIPIKKHFKRLLQVSLPENTINFIAQTDIKIWPKRASRLHGFVNVLVPKTNHDSIIKSKDLAFKISNFLKS